MTHIGLGFTPSLPLDRGGNMDSRLLEEDGTVQSDREGPRWGLFFHGMGGGEEVGVGEICEAVGEELAHVRDDPG